MMIGSSILKQLITLKCREEWLEHLNPLNSKDFIATRDDTMHPITHVGNVPLASLDGQQNNGDVLFVPTITKNFAWVG